MSLASTSREDRCSLIINHSFNPTIFLFSSFFLTRQPLLPYLFSDLLQSSGWGASQLIYRLPVQQGARENPTVFPHVDLNGSPELHKNIPLHSSKIDLFVKPRLDREFFRRQSVHWWRMNYFSPCYCEIIDRCTPLTIWPEEGFLRAHDASARVTRFTHALAIKFISTSGSNVGSFIGWGYEFEWQCDFDSMLMRSSSLVGIGFQGYDQCSHCSLDQ